MISSITGFKMVPISTRCTILQLCPHQGKGCRFQTVTEKALQLGSHQPGFCCMPSPELTATLGRPVLFVPS